MKLETSRGETYEVRSAAALTMRGQARLMIALGEEMTLAQAAQAFDGLEWVKVRGNTEGVTTEYAGYSRMMMITRADDGEVRVTLVREG